MFRASRAILTCMLVIAMGHTNIVINVAGDEENIPEWGFYVYMAGDNTLTDEVEDDLNEMRLVGSNQNRVIVALTDQINGDDSHAYQIKKSGFEETQLNQINNTWQNELDMGNKNTLRDFMIWASNEYPAEKKILVIWNHGSGWEKVAEDKDSHLTVPEIRVAMEEYRQETGDPKLTLLAFDACLMGMFEIAYELKDEAEMIHGSEAYEPLEGWTYNHLLYKLKPGLTNEKLAEHVVTDYVESYRNGSVYTGYSVTSAVVETSKLNEIWSELDNLSSELISVKQVYQNQTRDAREQTQRYDQNPNYRDLYDLSTNIKNNIPIYGISQSANKVQLAIDEAVIVEDHWQKPEKLPVDRAHGLTIYFPTEGPKQGYEDLRIKDNKWYQFIQEYATDLGRSANLETINATSIDTGTGYNDSVHVNGTYSGNASNIQIRLVNNEGKLTSFFEGNLSGGLIQNLYLQPTKSGKYTLSVELYNNEGYLEDHYIEENLFIDLRLPDLSVKKPSILINDNEGINHEADNLQNNDIFVITGDIENVGTIPANNVSVFVKTELRNYTFNLHTIKQNQTKTWSINDTSEISITGNYTLDIQIDFSNEYEIDATNNQRIYSFQVFEEQAHDYLITSKNKNVIELQTGDTYEFSWLESYVTFTNNKLQPWDLINIDAEMPEDWDIITEEILHLSDSTEITVRIKPSISTLAGEYKVGLKATDRNGLPAGYGEITVNIPQYYGVKISAKQIDNYAEITIENSGNGNDYFVLSKVLEDGLSIYLPETRFELQGFESKTIKTIGLETEKIKPYNAQFIVKSEGNQNISASVTLPVVKNISEGTESNNIQVWIIGFLGLAGISYLVYQRRIS